MPNYKGRRKGTRRIIVYHHGKNQEWVIEATKTEGAKFEARQRLKYGVVGPAPRTVGRFSSLFQDYATHAAMHLKSNTWNVRRYLLSTLEEHFGELKVDQITVQHIEAYKRSRVGTVGPRAINNELMAFRAVLTYGKDTGHPIPPVKWARLPERGTGRIRAWSEEEVQRIFGACLEKAPALLPVLVFLLNTGCRKGEAIAAEWSWMDFKRGLVCIPVNEYWSPKNGKPREIPMADAVRELFEAPRRSDRWVFPNRNKRRFKGFPHLIWQKVQKAAKVPGTPHWFRHSYASHFLQHTPDLFLLAQILGHSHQRVTELYSHLLPDHLERARNAVNIRPRQSLATTLAGATNPQPNRRLRLVVSR